MSVDQYLWWALYSFAAFLFFMLFGALCCGVASTNDNKDYIGFVGLGCMLIGFLCLIANTVFFVTGVMKDIVG